MNTTITSDYPRANRKGCLIEDYTNPVLRVLTHSVLSSLLLENKSVPFYAAFDATVLHFKHWTNIVFDSRSKSAWRKILEGYYETDAYKKLNEVVHGSEILSKYATIAFLNSLVREASSRIASKNLRATQCSQCDSVGSLIALLDSKAVPPKVEAAIVSTIVATLSREAERILEDLRVAQSFSHIGIPIARFLENPDKFRRIASNRIIVHFVRFLNKLRNEPMHTKIARVPTLVGGRPLGVKKIQRWSELTRTLPSELIDEDTYLYKVSSRNLRVYEQYGNIPRYVVYLDKCIASGTLIPLVDGVKPIEDVEVGDVVLGAKFVNGEPLPSSGRVVEKRYSGIQEVIRIKTETGEGIVLTPNHIVYARRRGEKEIVEVPAGILSVGDELLVASKYDALRKPNVAGGAGGEEHFVFSKIVSMEPAGEAHTWDLVVEDYHNFIANNILVHNSGSMAGDIKYCETPTKCERVPKISFAAASAIALAWALKRVGSKMTLKLFDVEVHEPVADYSKLIEVLMKVDADSGTNITKVLEDAIINHKDDKIVIVTDGIDAVAEDVVKRARALGMDITVIFIDTDNELLRKHFKHVHIKEARPSILLEV